MPCNIELVRGRFSFVSFLWHDDGTKTMHAALFSIYCPASLLLTAIPFESRKVHFSIVLALSWPEY